MHISGKQADEEDAAGGGYTAGRGSLHLGDAWRVVIYLVMMGSSTRVELSAGPSQ